MIFFEGGIKYPKQYSTTKHELRNNLELLLN